MKKTKNITDAELIIAYQAGETKALSQLVKRWHVSFCKFAYWYVKDADIAKDIAQESWAVIIRKIQDLKDPEKFKSWAISIVNRKAIDWIRAQHNEGNKLQQFYKEHRKEYLDVKEDHRVQKKKQLLDAIYQLSEDQQVIVRLFYTQSYSLKEISESLHISVGTAKSRLFHAREKLKTILKT
jgi:RNA polymerase sigma-70 factor (ECF subfamily)